MQFPLNTGNTKTYWAMTNWWGGYSNQTVDFNGLSFTVNNALSSSDNDPVGYPSLNIGSYQGRTTVGSNMPLLVSSIGSIPTVFSTNITSSGSDSNASIDVWFQTSSNLITDDRPDAGYLMVWLNKPSGRQPRGSLIGSATISTYGTFDVWYEGEVTGSDGRAQKPCISYVPSSAVNSLDFDLKAFIDDAVNKSKIQSSWYLHVIFGGFEIWSGGGQTLNNFCTKVNPL